MAAWEEPLRAMYIFLPAFVANMSPVFTAKLVPRWRTPIDFGGVHRDGRRVFGDGKTWRGLLLGGGLAGVTALLMGLFPPAWSVLAGLDYGRAQGASAWGIFLFGFAVGTGALIGDVAESYAKRRRGKVRGEAWFPFDQLDFVVGGLAAALLWHPLLGGTWALQHLFTFWVIGTLLVVTPLLHLVVNRIGYWLKLKEVPW